MDASKEELTRQTNSVCLVSFVRRIIHCLGKCAVTPIWPAAPAVRADAKATDLRSRTSRGATLPGSSEGSGRQFFVRVENLHTKRQITSLEFRQAFIDQQGINRFHRLHTFALNRLQYA